MNSLGRFAQLATAVALVAPLSRYTPAEMRRMRDARPLKERVQKLCSEAVRTDSTARNKSKAERRRQKGNGNVRPGDNTDTVLLGMTPEELEKAEKHAQELHFAKCKAKQARWDAKSKLANKTIAIRDAHKTKRAKAGKIARKRNRHAP